MTNQPDGTRRRFLRSLGGVAAGSVALGSAGVAGAAGGDARERAESDGGPHRGCASRPADTVIRGESAPLGAGEVTAFASVGPSGATNRVGVRLSEGALDDLPGPAELAAAGRGVELPGGRWSKMYALGLPDVVPEPLRYVGFGWNPTGHAPRGVYTRPHFDVHFYFRDRSAVRGIGPGTVESLPDERTPDGYRLIEGGAVVPDMGAHLAPADAPEFGCGEWLRTLIWGAADTGDGPELHFVEPMVTLDYLRNHLDGVSERPVAQPAVYPRPGRYPTAYEVRACDGGGYVVAVGAFEAADAVVDKTRLEVE